MRISATVTKDVSIPSASDWGRRFQAFFGVWGGKMEGFFVFTTGVSRVDIDKAIHGIGIRSRQQVSMEEVAQRPCLQRKDNRRRPNSNLAALYRCCHGSRRAVCDQGKAAHPALF